MTTKELILTEVENAREEDLDALYEMIRRFNAARCRCGSEEGALARLKHIRIDAPGDFSVNLDLYVSGEKPFATGPDVD